MTRLPFPRALAPLLGVLLVAAEPGGGEAELVVRNDSFSTLEIGIIDAARHDVDIGQAPPEFTNTLYFPAGDDPVEVRFRARLRGDTEALHVSRPVRVRAGTRLRWTLPDNVIESLRARATEADAAR